MMLEDSLVNNAPLDRAIKNPEVGKAFYSYALEYVRLNPDFDKRKIPMTNTKLMMINRDNNIVHEFVKQEYVCQNRDIEESSSYLYNRFKSWLQDSYGSAKKPPTVQEFTRTLGGLGLKSKRKRVGDRKADKKMEWYSASYKDLYTIFRKKNMIDDAENIDEPEEYQPNENVTIVYTEVLPAEEPSNNLTSLESASQPEPEKNTHPIPDSPNPSNEKLDIEKPSLSITMDDLLDELQNYIEDIKEIDSASISLPESPKLETVVVEPIPAVALESEPYRIPVLPILRHSRLSLKRSQTL